MKSLQSWPEPVVRVQALSESGIRAIPDRYVKPPSDRPSVVSSPMVKEVNIPVIDLKGLFVGANGPSGPDDPTLRQINEACRDWGFFQVVNHGVDPKLMRMMRESWREFFHLPLEAKQRYANSPCTYEGYGSRLGVEKGDRKSVV